MRRRPTGAVAIGTAALLAVGLGTQVMHGVPGAGGPEGGAAAHPTTRPLYRNAGAPTHLRLSDLLHRMTLAEKVGQMTQAERAEVDSDTSKITSERLGSVMSGGGSVPSPNRPYAWADMVDRYQTAALQTRLHIPLLYGIDTLHGDGNMYGATVFPHNIGLGATRDPALVRRVEQVAASETRATGPQWAFAPCICVARDDRWGRTYESFGETPSLVERMETAIDGFQGLPGHLSDNTSVLATTKHFAGDGLAAYGTGSNAHHTGTYAIDQGVDIVSHRTFRRLALMPYVSAVHRHHVTSVMLSYSDVDWTKDGLGNRVNLHGDRSLVTGWLKQKQGFQGVVISDDNGIDHIHPEWGPSSDPTVLRKRVAAGANAGIDMFMQPQNFAEFETQLMSLVRDGPVSRARIDDAVRRILRVKFELGLFDQPYTDRTHIHEVGDRAHRAVARRAVAESQVLLKNRKATLPLAKRGRPVYVAGSNANDIGNQAGGWTLTWRGGSGNVIPGTTILQAIREASRSRVRFSQDASARIPSRAVGVVVVGETPYAEGVGDVRGRRSGNEAGDHGRPGPPQTMRLSAADDEAVRKVCARAARCVVLVVSGRPMIVPATLRTHIDALVASWLPGSEGEGVADVLFGSRPFTGRLPVSWPRTLAQEPINVGDRSYQPLYPFGWGLHTK